MYFCGLTEGISRRDETGFRVGQAKCRGVFSLLKIGYERRKADDRLAMKLEKV